MENRVPSFFVVGTPKGGTTKLYMMLSSLDAFFLPAEKELDFWTRDDEARANTMHSYLKHFDKANGNQIIGEASPNYFASSSAISNIEKVIGEGKYIVSLRDPVDRLVSHILMMKRNNGWKTDVEDLILENLKSDKYNLVDEGRYDKHLQRLYKTVGQKNVLVLIFEEWIKKPQETLNIVCNFLGATRGHYVDNGKPINAYKEYKNPLIKLISTHPKVRQMARRVLPSSARLQLKDQLTVATEKPSVSNELKEKLKKVYRGHNEQLAELLNKKLPWNI